MRDRIEISVREQTITYAIKRKLVKYGIIGAVSLVLFLVMLLLCP